MIIEILLYGYRDGILIVIQGIIGIRSVSDEIHVFTGNGPVWHDNIDQLCISLEFYVIGNIVNDKSAVFMIIDHTPEGCACFGPYIPDQPTPDKLVKYDSVI